MNTTDIGFTTRGNAVGFTAKGETIVGKRDSGTGRYSIWLDTTFSMLDSRTRRFDTLVEARNYAASLIDQTKTEELAWW